VLFQPCYVAVNRVCSEPVLVSQLGRTVTGGGPKRDRY